MQILFVRGQLANGSIAWQGALPYNPAGVSTYRGVLRFVLSRSLFSESSPSNQLRGSQLLVCCAVRPTFYGPPNRVTTTVVQRM